MKQTVEEAAKKYSNDCRNRQRHCEPYCIVDFIQGAEWQSKQSPWISVKERLPEPNKLVLCRMVSNGAIVSGYIVVSPGLNLRIGTTTSVTCGCLFRLLTRYSKPTGMCLNGLRRKETNMERYRIIRGEGCNGCIPIIIYWVQVRKDKRISYEWVNVKGFDTYKRAKELLNVLKGGIDYEQI